jgi:hypothetical protein
MSFSLVILIWCLKYIVQVILSELIFYFYFSSASDKTVDTAVLGGYLAFAQEVRVRCDHILFRYFSG